MKPPLQSAVVLWTGEGKGAMASIVDDCHCALPLAHRPALHQFSWEYGEQPKEFSNHNGKECTAGCIDLTMKCWWSTPQHVLEVKQHPMIPKAQCSGHVV